MNNESDKSDHPNDPLGVDIGLRIKALRRVNHLTQAELARRIGIRTGPMNALENGHHIPSGRVLFRLAEVLETSVDSLLGVGQQRGAGGGTSGMPLYVAESAEYNVPQQGTQWPMAVMASLPDDTPLDKAGRVMVDQVMQAFLALED